jgi:hypothetical protein
VKKQQITLSNILWLITGVALLCLLSFSTVLANGIAQGYVSSDPELKTGMLAALSADSSRSGSYIERASTSSQARAVGIVANIEDSLVSVSDGQSSIYVISSGTTTALVSDLNGLVKNGDTLVASPIKGVLMKADEQDIGDIVAGVALADFDDAKATIEQVNRQNGDKKDVLVGPVLLQLGVKGVQRSSSSLESFGIAITGSPVSQLRMIIAAIILFTLLLVEVAIVYGAISSSITAIGRNPMARKDIYKQLVQTIIIAVCILFAAVIGLYVVIWT